MLGYAHKSFDYSYTFSRKPIVCLVFSCPVFSVNPIVCLIEHYVGFLVVATINIFSSMNQVKFEQLFWAAGSCAPTWQFASLNS